jgi:hypothetical protein
VLGRSHTVFQRYMQYDGRQNNPGTFTVTNLPQTGKNLAVGRTAVSVALTRERVQVRLQLRLPSDGSRSASTVETGSGDIGLRNLPAEPIRSTTAVRHST